VDARSNYPPEQPDGQWYQQDRGYPEADWERRGADPLYAEQPASYAQQPAYGDYHVPEPRAEHRYADPADLRPTDAGGATTQMPPVAPRPGEQLPPDAAPVSGPRGDDSVRHATESIDRAALRRPAAGPGPLGDGVYKSRRPGTAAGLTAVTVLFEVVALRLLWVAFFAHPVQVGGSMAAAFLALGLPMFALGMYGLLGGSAGTPGAGPRVWLRPPLVYLPVALVLFVAAGLAA